MDPAALITDEVISRFATDGVVYLPQAITQDWIELLRSGVAHNLANPSPRARVWDRNAEGGSCLYDSQVWPKLPQYRDFILDSPLGELAGRVLASDQVNFFFDAIFVRSPGNQFRTPFHQDEPYWSVSGFDTCSVWMPLVPVAAKSALEFVRGSHRWPQKFRQTNFGAMTGDERDQVVMSDDLEPFPDIEGDRPRYDLVSWDMVPGDLVMFNARIIHGGSGNLDPGCGLTVFNTQWLGDDVRVIVRPEGMDPDHSSVMAERGLRPGDRVGTDLYPEVWRRPVRLGSGSRR